MKKFTSVDKIGFTISLACAIHCATLPILVTFLPMIGGEFLSNPLFESVLLLFSILVAFFVLIRDFRQVHNKRSALYWAGMGFTLIFLGHFWHEIETGMALSGGVMLLNAYFVNWKHIREVKNCSCEV